MKKLFTKIVIIGAPRSGTTLLNKIIASSDACFPMLPECSFLTALIRQYFNILNYSDAGRFDAFAVNETLLKNIYVNAVSNFIKNTLHNFPKIQRDYLTLKDPELSLFPDLIPNFFGEDQTKVICIIRDPRYVVASMFRVNQKKKKLAWKDFSDSKSISNFKKLLDVYFLNRTIVEDTYNFFFRIHTSEILKNGNLYVVRFEKIIFKDEIEFAGIENFLGIKLKRDLLKDPLVTYNTNDVFFSENYNQPISASVKDFNDVLNYCTLRKIKRLFAQYNATYHWW